MAAASTDGRWSRRSEESLAGGGPLRTGAFARLGIITEVLSPDSSSRKDCSGLGQTLAPESILHRSSVVVGTPSLGLGGVPLEGLAKPGPA